MLRLWGHRQAPNVRKVLWTCAELGLPFEQVDIGGPFGGTDSRDYRSLNPNGRIPTLEDDGFVLWESHAIMRYLAAQARCDTLYPKDVRSRARVDQWLDWQGAHLAQAIRDLVRLTVKAQAASDPVRLAMAEREADLHFAIVDRALGSSDHIAGGEFTLADIPIGIGYRRWSTLPVARQPLPALEAWFGRVSVRPAFIAIDGG